MNIKDLTIAMQQFVNSQGWYEENSSRPQTLRNLVISLNLEASEVLELFQWNETNPDLLSLGNELADVTLYLLQIANIAGIDLEKAVMDKLSRNYERKWDQID